MKTIKRVAIFLLCIFGAVSVALAQQGFRVSVLNDIKEPLPHAYIYVNGRAVAVADTLGLAVIPQDKLTIGDTISISYVATEGQTVVFDQNLSTTGEYQFILPEIYASLQADAVVVKADFDIRKHYRKHVKNRQAYRFYCIWNSDFSMNINKSGNNVRTVEGKFRNAPASSYEIARALGSDISVLDSKKYTVSFNNELPLEISTLDDTIGLSYTIKNFLPTAIDLNYSILYAINFPEQYTLKVTYGYLGKDERHRIFRLTYSKFKSGTRYITYQILLKCEIKSGDVREITMNMMNLNSGNVSSLNAKISNKRVGSGIMSSVRYFPTELESRVESNLEVIDVTMKNINIQPFGKPKEKYEQTIRRVMRTGKLE